MGYSEHHIRGATGNILALPAVALAHFTGPLHPPKEARSLSGCSRLRWRSGYTRPIRSGGESVTVQTTISARVVLAIALVAGSGVAAGGDWAGDLNPIARADWNEQRAAHLLDRAGFGGAPGEIAELATRPPIGPFASS